MFEIECGGIWEDRIRLSVLNGWPVCTPFSRVSDSSFKACVAIKSQVSPNCFDPLLSGCAGHVRRVGAREVSGLPPASRVRGRTRCRGAFSLAWLVARQAANQRFHAAHLPVFQQWRSQRS